MSTYRLVATILDLSLPVTLIMTGGNKSPTLYLCVASVPYMNNPHVFIR